MMKRSENFKYLLRRLTIPAFLLLCITSPGSSSEPPLQEDHQQGTSGEIVYEFDLREAARSDPQISQYSDDSPTGEPALRFKSLEGSAPLALISSADEVPWEKAGFMVADVWHTNRSSAILQIHFFRSGDESPRISSKMGILPELKTRLVLPLEYLDGQTFFMARQERRLKGTMPGNRLFPREIDRVTCTLGPTGYGFKSELWIERIWLSKDRPQPLPPAKEPIVDEAGQWKTRDWPDRITDVDSAVEKIRQLHRDVTEAGLPDQWSRFGGWKEKKFQPSGFFQVAESDGRWWLVDPDGYAFFSIGLDVINPSSSGTIEGMEDLFSWLPEPTGRFAPARSVSRGLEEASFLTSNLIRAFGSEWEEHWQEMTRGLLREWRFNTIGNWSNRDFIASAQMPYVLPLANFPTTSTLLYRDFPDVFSPEYREASGKFANQMEFYRDDPYLIGYFLRNEPLWAFGRNNLAEEMLAADTESHTRRRLIQWLQERYATVEELSDSWDYPVGSFEDLSRRSIPESGQLSERAQEDLWEFSKLMVIEYLRHPSEALREMDPQHLNLGIRYASISSDLCYEGSEYFDVFSINAYQEKPDAELIEQIHARTGSPVMIGEFHHGAIDRGLPSTGIYGVASQEERGTAYRYYIEQGAALPALVGMHYFQLNDQPVLGRFDGENYNIGLVDICNQPHREMTRSVSETNEFLYEVVSGRRTPSSKRARAIPRIYF